MVHEFLSKEFMSYYESLLCTWYLVHCTIRILNSAFFNRRSAFDISFNPVFRTSYFVFHEKFPLSPYPTILLRSSRADFEGGI